MSLFSILVQITGIILLFLIVYLLVCLVITLILAKLPRDNINDRPNWGFIEDIRVPTVNGKNLECWVVKPAVEIENCPAVILLHGWGRNRGRMVSRARIYAQNGYTTILFSARDHGKSSKERIGMSIIKFKEDLDAIINWWSKPVILVGHSIGAGATLLVGSRNPFVKALIAEATPVSFPHDFKHVYRPALRGLTRFFIPGITFIILIIFRRAHNNDYSPLEVANRITIPTFIINGMRDDIFPYQSAELLKSKIPNCEIWLPEDGTHYNLENLPDYESKTISFLEKYL